MEDYDSLISQYLTQPPESGFMIFQKPNYFPPGGLFQIYKDSTGDTDNKLEFVSNNTDSIIKYHHYKYKQTYKGLDVEGAGCIEHFNTDWSLDYTQSKLATNLDISVDPTIRQDLILNYLLDSLSSETEYAWNDTTWEAELQDMANDPNATHFPTPELLLMIDSYKDVLYEIPASRYTLAYKIHIVTLNPYQARDFYLDAHTGSVIKTRNVGDHSAYGLCGAYNYGTANSIDTKKQGVLNKWYLIATSNQHNFESRYLQDATADPKWTDCGSRKSSSNVWGNTYLTSTSAHYFVQKTWDFFDDLPYNRKGMDNAGGEIHIRVGYAVNDSKMKYHPISWKIPRLTFGTQNSFDHSWDPSIVAHEYVHGIRDFTSNLEYEFESGALDESFSDIFGIIVQAKALDINSTDYNFWQ